MKLSKSGVYSIRHLGSNRRYIGSSANVADRWTQHRSMLRSGRHHCLWLQRAFQKYGESDFEWAVLECVKDQADLRNVEQRWMDEFSGATYNTAPSSQSRIGVKATPETIEKIRLASTGRTHSDEAKAKISEYRCEAWLDPEYRDFMSAVHKGKTVSDETREKQRACKIGKTHTDAAKAKISESGMGRPVSPETRDKIAEAKRGKAHSEASIANMQVAQRKCIAHKIKSFTVVSPDGETFHVDGLASFCEARGLVAKRLYDVASGRKSTWKGWKCHPKETHT